MWKVCSEPFMNANKIFPTQQRDVKKIIDACSQDSNITKIIIFGSSITSACNPWSDIDVYVEMKEDKQWPRIDVHEVPLDKWTNFMVDDNLYKEIKMGVTVYIRK